MDNKQVLIVETIVSELESAKRKHPNWPTDVVHQAAIVNEEAGELIRAALMYQYEDGNKESLRHEAIQTAAMCIRFLENLDPE